jgi:type IV secretory pathway TrbF-like protein
VNRATPLFGVACLALAAASFLPASAQMSLTPHVVQIDQLKCAELLSRTDERRDRLLLYFNGYVDGVRRHTTWDEVAVGAMIERAIGYCQANPAETILAAFTRASR